MEPYRMSSFLSHSLYVKFISVFLSSKVILSPGSTADHYRNILKSIHSTVDRHLDCFHAQQSCTCLLVHGYMHFCQVYPRRWGVGQAVLMLCLYWILPNSFQSCSTNLQSPQQCLRVLVAAQACQHLVWTEAIEARSRWNDAFKALKVYNCQRRILYRAGHLPSSSTLPLSPGSPAHSALLFATPSSL